MRIAVVHTADGPAVAELRDDELVILPRQVVDALALEAQQRRGGRSTTQAKRGRLRIATGVHRGVQIGRN